MQIWLHWLHSCSCFLSLSIARRTTSDQYFLFFCLFCSFSLYFFLISTGFWFWEELKKFKTNHDYFWIWSPTKSNHQFCVIFPFKKPKIKKNCLCNLWHPPHRTYCWPHSTLCQPQNVLILIAEAKLYL